MTLTGLTLFVAALGLTLGWLCLTMLKHHREQRVRRSGPIATPTTRLPAYRAVPDDNGATSRPSRSRGLASLVQAQRAAGERPDCPVSLSCEVEQKLSEAFDTFAKGDISITTYRNVVEAEYRHAATHISVLKHADERALLEDAAQAMAMIEWCLSWADQQHPTGRAA